MATTDYKAAWRNARAAKVMNDPIFATENDKKVGRNYDAICDSEPPIGDAAKEGLHAEFPRQTPNCKSSDVAARYLAHLVPREWGVNVTGIAKAIVGDGLGAALINVYSDTDPVFTNSDTKASLKIYQDWACPFEILNDDKNVLKVGQPKRNDAGQTVAGINATGKMDIEY